MHTSEAYSLLIQSIYNRMHFSLSLYWAWVEGWIISLNKLLCLRSSVSAHTSIAYHIYVYIYILLYLQASGKNKSCRLWYYALYQLCISLLRGQLFEQNGSMSPMKLAIGNWFSCNINACPFSRSPALAESPSLTVLIHCRQV